MLQVKGARAVQNATILTVTPGQGTPIAIKQPVRLNCMLGLRLIVQVQRVRVGMLQVMDRGARHAIRPSTDIHIQDHSTVGWAQLATTKFTTSMQTVRYV